MGSINVEIYRVSFENVSGNNEDREVKQEGEENTQTKVQRNISIKTNEEERTQEENTIGPDQFGKFFFLIPIYIYPSNCLQFCFNRLKMINYNYELLLSLSFFFLSRSQ